jgi:hypothetical protein
MGAVFPNARKPGRRRPGEPGHFALSIPQGTPIAELNRASRFRWRGRRMREEVSMRATTMTIVAIAVVTTAPPAHAAGASRIVRAGPVITTGPLVGAGGISVTLNTQISYGVFAGIGGPEYLYQFNVVPNVGSPPLRGFNIITGGAPVPVPAVLLATPFADLTIWTAPGDPGDAAVPAPLTPPVGGGASPLLPGFSNDVAGFGFVFLVPPVAPTNLFPNIATLTAVPGASGQNVGGKNWGFSYFSDGIGDQLIRWYAANDLVASPDVLAFPNTMTFDLLSPNGPSPAGAVPNAPGVNAMGVEVDTGFGPPAGVLSGALADTDANAGAAIVASAAMTCSAPGPAGVPTANTVAGGAVLDAGYTLVDAFDVLRLLYAGLDHNGVFDCNGPHRRELVSNWSNFFGTPCAAGSAACATGLRHAWRLSDQSEFTDALIQLMGFGGRVPGAQNPFCNARDANPSAAPNCGATLACTGGFSCDVPGSVTNSGHCVLSSTGRNDYADFDPIRIPCATTETVCEPTNGLGLVLPIKLSGTAADYPTVACSGGCALESPAPVAQLPAGFHCPDGQLPQLGRCWHPMGIDSSGNPTFACLNQRFGHCFGAATADGRAYNKAIISPTVGRPAAYAIDANHLPMDGAFFRIQMPTCELLTDSEMVGCLSGADACSMGFAGDGWDVAGTDAALGLF